MKTKKKGSAGKKPAKKGGGELKIEKGVAMPSTIASANASPLYITMVQLNVGESFLITDKTDMKRARKVASDANGRERKRGGEIQYATRAVDGGVRVWRIK